MEHLIESVRKYPCLWNTTAIEYRDQELKDAAWAEVMKDTDLTSVKEVKLKWKKLRDSYRDALKRQSELAAREGGAGAGAGKRSYPWKYMGLMRFLQPHMSARKKPSDGPTAPANGVGDADAGVDSYSDDSDPEDEKRKAIDRLSAVERRLDRLYEQQRGKRACREQRPPATPTPEPLDIFFNGMCQATKRLPYPAQIKIKKTLFGAVVSAEEAALLEQQSYASLWAAGAPSTDSSDDDRKPL